MAIEKRKFVEIIRITDVYFTQSMLEGREDKMHLRVMTPEGPKEIWMDYETYDDLEDFLSEETGNYFYEELKSIE